MPQNPIYQERETTIYSQGRMQPSRDQIVIEMPLTVYLNDDELATVICSPGGHEELAVGFLLSEGLLESPADIKEITFNEKDSLLWVETKTPVPHMENFLRRQIASCCGKGRASLYFVNDARQLQPVHSDSRFAAPHILRLVALLEERSATFRRTGGVHSAALGGSDGLLVMYEDIGRHNAVDKVLGYAFLNRIELEDKFLVLSGRVSSEILIKAARRGIPLVVSRSAPTLLAVDLADEFGMTIVGFARGERLNIYSHAERVTV